MISTENNNALEEVQKEKFEIQELNKKIKNFDNDPELKDSLAEALISKTATGENLSIFNDLYYSKVLKHEGFTGRLLDNSKNLDENTKDLLWSLVFTIAKFSHSMYNIDFNEGFSSYLDTNRTSNASYKKYDEYIKYWVSDNIVKIFTKDELDKILNNLGSGIEKDLDGFISNIVEETCVVDDIDISEKNYPLIYLLDNILSDVKIYTDKSSSGDIIFNIKGSGIYFNFRSLIPPDYYEFEKCEDSIVGVTEDVFYKYKKYKVLYGKYLRFVVVNLMNYDLGGNRSNRKKLKKRFLSDTNLKDFLRDELKSHTEDLLLNKNKLYRWSN